MRNPKEDERKMNIFSQYRASIEMSVDVWVAVQASIYLVLLDTIEGPDVAQDIKRLEGAADAIRSAIGPIIKRANKKGDN
jgi:hypothetical protein